MSVFQVNGKPFFPLGGQANNSSAYNAGEIASAIAGVLALGGNTLEAPVYWGQVEPREGQFDFAPATTLVEECRKNGLRLVILWFASWKNGEMRYAPEWVKRDRERFRRALRPDGTEMQALSAFCAESRDADARAFAALMAHLKRIDGNAGTVIAVQVENEPGILGCDRDYGAEARAATEGPVPPELVDALKARGRGPAWDAWQACGAREAGNWLDLFGLHGGEFAQAWHLARYIDAVAAAGRREYRLPLYLNVWLGEQGWGIPGFYPSGGAVGRTLDIWKAAASHLDLIAPDIYIGNFNDYRAACAAYCREDNPLFVPESGANDRNALNMMRAVADFGAIGYCCFAIDTVLSPEGEIRPDCALFAESFRCIRNMLPLILKYRDTGRIHAVVQEEHQPAQRLEFEKFIGCADFGRNILHYHLDHRHSRNPQWTEGKPCYGLIVEAGPGEFYLSGNFRLYMVPKKSPEWNAALLSPLAFVPPDYLSVKEGYLDEDGAFTAVRERNGDESSWASFWATAYCGVVRVRLNV
jgi:beta-galactosidase GanA